ncbi:hypothetical protein EGP99_02795 [bacterium]|nr:hypothetical protein [bacterium]
MWTFLIKFGKILIEKGSNIMNNKKYIIISVIVGIVFLAMGVLIGLVYSNRDVIFKENNISNENNMPKNDLENDNINEIKEETKGKERYEEVPKKNNETIKNEVTKPSLSNKDNTIINEMDNTLNSINTESSSSNFSDKAKATFISIVDFLFYDGTIKGVTFNELTDAGKQKVLELANKIDVKLEEKAPGYKDKISSSTSSAYNKASEVIKNGASSLNNFAKEKLGDENYNSIIDAKNELVKYSKNALNLVGSAGSKIFSSTKDKLNDWYQNFKNNK